jgi:hypothetical protein
MAAFHQSYVTAANDDILWAIYQFLTDGSQTVMQIVNDGTLAVNNGSTYIVPTQASDLPVNSFIVVEPTFDNPSGARRWQAKITRSLAARWNIEGSPNGGFSTSSSTFGANPTTGDQQWQGAGVQAGDTLYLSSDDSDTYDGGTKKYGWFRALQRDMSTGAARVEEAFYTGGYIPFDVAADTDPYLMLAGTPLMGDAGFGVPYSWGNGINTTCPNRAPLENGAAVSSMVSAGYAYVAANQEVNDHFLSKTRVGVQVELQIFVHTQNSECLGYLGENTMVGIAEDITNWTTNTGATRLSVNDFGMAWV